MSQHDLILDYLKDGNSLTALEALDKFKTFRLAARIEDLRRDGYQIYTETVKENGKKFARYQLLPTAPKKHIERPLSPSNAGCGSPAPAARSLFDDQEQIINGRSYYNFKSTSGV